MASNAPHTEDHLDPRSLYRFQTTRDVWAFELLSCEKLVTRLVKVPILCDRLEDRGDTTPATAEEKREIKRQLEELWDEMAEVARSGSALLEHAKSFLDYPFNGVDPKVNPLGPFTQSDPEIARHTPTPVASYSPRYPTVVRDPNGTFVELRCYMCDGNATASRTRRRAQFLRGVGGFQNHLHQGHNIRLSPQMTLVKCTVGWLLPRQVQALHDETPNAPQIEKVECPPASNAHVEGVSDRLSSPVSSEVVDDAVNGISSLLKTGGKRGRSQTASPESEPVRQQITEAHHVDTAPTAAATRTRPPVLGGSASSPLVPATTTATTGASAIRPSSTKTKTAAKTVPSTKTLWKASDHPAPQRSPIAPVWSPVSVPSPLRVDDNPELDLGAHGLVHNSYNDDEDESTHTPASSRRGILKRSLRAERPGPSKRVKFGPRLVEYEPGSPPPQHQDPPLSERAKMEMQHWAPVVKLHDGTYVSIQCMECSRDEIRYIPAGLEMLRSHCRRRHEATRWWLSRANWRNALIDACAGNEVSEREMRLMWMNGQGHYDDASEAENSEAED
ncbi:hypothetical protein BU16DRAFT_604113 [Lophium mytilinum]|uniref:Uncharacterized protein n=1 Tax=Lophium mytilinum TaxID=390894 RepID=A0A6A6R523_9PEZI|nr:hypothetical protein BU16DRAFT_604113 [Lophium mytilinum]